MYQPNNGISYKIKKISFKHIYFCVGNEPTS